MIKLLPLCASLLLTSCAGRSSPPAASPPPAASGVELQSTGAAEAQGETKKQDEQGETRVQDDLKVDLAAVDAALANLGKRLDVARGDVKAEMEQQVASLQRREDDLKAQLKASAALSGAEVEKARREIHRAIMDLKIDMMQVRDRISR